MPSIMITSPLEPEHVARIRAVDASLEVLYEPNLLPATRYTADHKGVAFTRDAAQTAAWRALLGKADILFDLPAAEDVPFATRASWVQTTSTGVGQTVAKLGLDQRGILVTTARGVHARPLAEFVFMALLAHIRGLDHLRAEQRAHRWERYCGPEIANRTMVILGAGDLARGCGRLAQAFDMRCIAVARDPARTRAHNGLFNEILPVAQLHDALSQADAFVVTAPHTPQNPCRLRQCIRPRAWARIEASSGGSIPGTARRSVNAPSSGGSSGAGSRRLLLLSLLLDLCQESRKIVVAAVAVVVVVVVVVGGGGEGGGGGGSGGGVGVIVFVVVVVVVVLVVVVVVVVVVVAHCYCCC